MNSAALSPKKYACVCSSVNPAVADQFSYERPGTRRFDAVFPQMIVVVGFNVSVFAFGGTRPVRVLDADPFIETMLPDHVIAEMPFSEVRAVIVLADSLRDRRTIFWKRDVVAMQTDSMRV